MRAVTVQWVDSIRLPNAWEAPGEIEVEPKHLRHTSIGFLARDEPEFIIVCTSRQDAEEIVGQCIVIPRVAIVSMVDVISP